MIRWEALRERRRNHSHDINFISLGVGSANQMKESIFEQNVPDIFTRLKYKLAIGHSNPLMYVNYIKCLFLFV